MSSRLLTLQETANMLKIHPETLRRWDNSGKLPATKIGERNDRRYKEEDILSFIKDHLSAKFSYKDYEIQPDGYGLERFPDRFGKITRYIVWNKDVLVVFAFAVPGLELFKTPDVSEKDLLNMAEKTIRETVDTRPLEPHKDYTFEYDGNEEKFNFKNKPDWWKKI